MSKVTTTHISRRWLLMVLAMSRDPQHQYAYGVIWLYPKKSTFICQENGDGASWIYLGNEWVRVPPYIRRAARNALLGFLNVDQKLGHFADLGKLTG